MEMEIFQEETLKKLKGRIHKAFIEIIPEDKWDALIKEEFSRFFQGPQSQARKAIRALLAEELNAVIKKEFDSGEYFGPYDPASGRNLPSEAIKKLMTEHSHQLLDAAVGSLVQSMIDAARNTQRFI